MLVWAVWCYPDTCLELLKVIWSWAVFPDVMGWYRIVQVTGIDGYNF